MKDLENGLVKGAQDEYEEQFQGEDKPEEKLVFNRQSFYECAADIMLPPTPESNLMETLRSGVAWMESIIDFQYMNNPAEVAFYSECMTRRATELGMMLIKQTIENGYTADQLEVEK